LDLKLLLKRGALVAAANWQVVVIQFAAQTAFKVLLAVPLIAGAVVVGVLMGGDLAALLQGGAREMLTAIADALRAEPAALVAFVGAFSIALLTGSIFMFLVKGGSVTVLLAAARSARAIESEPVTADGLRGAAAFSLERFTGGCRRLFRPYLALGLTLMLVYALSAGAYLTFVVIGYRASEGRAWLIGWTAVAALAGVALVLWITAVNLLYLLMQISIAAGTSPGRALPAVVRFIRTAPRELGAVFLVVLGLMVLATFASALVWSGVGLVAFVPLVGLAVFPLQMAALLLRGIVFEYIGLSALAAYASLYGRTDEALARAAQRERFGSDALGATSA
jgi:hypothetical protein